MSEVKITDLAAATSIDGSELFVASQNGNPVKITTDQIGYKYVSAVLPKTQLTVAWVKGTASWNNSLSIQGVKNEIMYIYIPNYIGSVIVDEKDSSGNSLASYSLTMDGTLQSFIAKSTFSSISIGKSDSAQTSDDGSYQITLTRTKILNELSSKLDGLQSILTVAWVKGTASWGNSISVSLNEGELYFFSIPSYVGSIILEEHNSVGITKIRTLSFTGTEVYPLYSNGNITNLVIGKSDSGQTSDSATFNITVLKSETIKTCNQSSTDVGNLMNGDLNNVLATLTLAQDDWDIILSGLSIQKGQPYYLQIPNYNGTIIVSEYNGSTFIRDFNVTLSGDAYYILFAGGDMTKLVFGKSASMQISATGSYTFNVITNKIKEMLSDVSSHFYDSDAQLTAAKNPLYNKIGFWCGTSVPAGGNYGLEDAGSYPYLVKKLLGCSGMYNEAVGSSVAKGVVVTSAINTTFEYAVKAMGNTIAEKMTIINDTWTIDDTAQTVTAGSRTLGLTSIPSLTYANAIQWRAFAIMCSYESKLLCKYLLSSTDGETYMSTALGSTLWAIIKGQYPAYFVHVDGVNFFCIDHLKNDLLTAEFTSDELVSYDLHTSSGAMNKYISLIKRYNPHANIYIISDYNNYFDTSKTLECQKQIADQWQLPFIEVYKHLPFTHKMTQTTCGYWDSTGVWHDTGFTWSDDGSTYTTNAYLNDYITNSGTNTLAQIKAIINPRTENSVQVYDMEVLYIWLKDGMHPHSDYSGKCLSFYASVLSKLLQNETLY